MKYRRLPRIIIVLGPPGTGKTSFVHRLKERYKVYNVINDFEPLQEIFHINDLIYQISKCENLRIRSKLLCEYKKLSNELHYAYKIWEDYIKEIERNEYVKPMHSIPDKSGGHKIIDPDVWDEILKLSVNNLKSNQNYALEFSRGRNKNYLVAKRISETQVYDHSMRLVESLLPFSLKESILIIHVSASYKIRNQRNEQRKFMNAHYVSRETMEQVYTSDVFQFIPEKLGSNKGWMKLSKPICVYSIDNNVNLSSNELSSFFSSELDLALDFFKSFSQTNKLPDC